ncbi:FHA domain-containing protein [Photobacterium sp. OFAV2-7]|uniref:FHA domain-containing protein n=1 Tax=Photobacterium sp. OFAV2-7 TaxID=2917748 RepID=UPI001EF4FEDE|nr:FHA domain-containing protein [Photobacterium sp. OFAV2-7]MCG7587380.1 FHA domain-containing protein [Photobacterium sp. OFAV2-7]
MSIVAKIQPCNQLISDIHNDMSCLLSPFDPQRVVYWGGVLKSSTGKHVYLRQYHTLGRSEDCHTILTRSDISRIHAIIFWQDDRWSIQDKSTNGVWVNDKKLVKDKPSVLQEGDTIVLSSKVGEVFTMVNVNEPCDLMVSIDSNQSPIYLQKPTTKVSEKLAFSYQSSNWNLIQSYSTQSENRKISDGEVIQILGNRYYLQSNRSEMKTCQNRPVVRTIEDLSFRLEVSDDEEDIQLFISDSEQSSVINGHRLQNQLYLLLCLARKSIADHAHGYAESHCGWLGLNELSHALGIEPENTRIRLHRLRTRLRDAASFSGIDACQILQLQNGDVRLNTTKVIVIKGGRAENDFACH